MSDQANYQKRVAFAQIASDTNNLNRDLTEKKEFVTNHLQTVKTLIQRYYHNCKTPAQKLSLVQEIKQLIDSIKCKRELLINDIKYLRALETESKAKLLSNQELRAQYDNESTERFLVLNLIKEKDSYEKKMKKDLDEVQEYSYFREFKRDIYVNKITSNPFATNIDDLSKNNQKKKFKQLKKREEQLELYHSSITKEMREIRTKKYHQRIDEGYIWKTMNDKYKTEISITMNNISSESISNCSSDSNDLFSLDELKSDEEAEANKSNIMRMKQETMNPSLWRKGSDMMRNPKSKRENGINDASTINLVNNLRMNGANEMQNRSSSSSFNNDETKLKLLKSQIKELKESILSSQRKISKYRNHQKKLKEHVNYLQLKSRFSDDKISSFDHIKPSEFGLSLKRFSFQNSLND